jgi:hypothetical protein
MVCRLPVLFIISPSVPVSIKKAFCFFQSTTCPGRSDRHHLHP